MPSTESRRQISAQISHYGRQRNDGLRVGNVTGVSYIDHYSEYNEISTPVLCLHDFDVY